MVADHDGVLHDRADDLRDRLLQGESEVSVVLEAFALVREASRRRLGIEHRDNQLAAAWKLLGRQVVELPTGEGKTLAATPALALRALRGRGVWLATANDYLARRDATTMQSVFELLGLSVGYLQTHSSPAERAAAYRCDITYGTIREFGFDFLRDKLSARRHRLSGATNESVQRERCSIIVDEADNIMLDDARTPLIISEPRTSVLDETVFQWSNITGRGLTPEQDYLIEAESMKVWLTETGRRRIRELAAADVLTKATFPELYDAVALSIESAQAFWLNRDYVVRDGKIVIIDKLNGRLAEGRQWQNGIQQSLEAANGLPITADTTPVAKVTVQAFLREFPHLSGMTGTATENSNEFRQAYALRTAMIPPFRSCRRRELPAQVFDTRMEKWSAVVESIVAMKRGGRPVLIGTRDLNATEELSDHLVRIGLSHQVLTARQEDREAELISKAGEAGMVTVSTSIAGRGTDIRLGPGVAELGGLHVIAADLFDASRIDRQLAGRGGRQGDPATYQQILSLQDALLDVAWEPQVRDRRIKSVTSCGVAPRLQMLRAAQREIESQHAASRRALLKRDRERTTRHLELGFDPCLDDAES